MCDKILANVANGKPIPLTDIVNEIGRIIGGYYDDCGQICRIAKGEYGDAERIGNYKNPSELFAAIQLEGYRVEWSTGVGKVSKKEAFLGMLQGAKHRRNKHLGLVKTWEMEEKIIQEQTTKKLLEKAGIF